MNLVVDTGAAMTTVVPHVLDRVGYGAHMGERIARISSAIGYEDTYTIRIARLSVLGYEFPGLLVNAADLTDYRVIDGLLGLDILRRFDCTLQFSHGQIVLEPIGPSV